MSLKAFVLAAPLALGGLWASGAMGSSVYSRDVNRSPAQVMEALSDLDITDQPGSPGTDPSASGGVAPLFRTERTDNSITFYVMSGDKVATRMTAFLEPLDGGKSTRVTAMVERGDAPDDFVSPAFRSEGLTMGLFSVSLEDELNELVAPPRRTAAECQQIQERLLMANAGDLGERSMAAGTRTIMRVHAVEGELRRQGCDTSFRGDDFAPVSNAMGSPPPEGVTIQPGQPMVDVSRTVRR